MIASTGVARIWMMLVEYSAQRNRGMRKKLMPGGRSMWTEAMKFTPVRIEEKPRMNTPIAAIVAPVAVPEA